MPNTSPLRAFGEADGDLRHLGGRTIGFIGYGNQGRAQALNLRDSLRQAQTDGGVRDILVGVKRDDSWAQAEADGFSVQAVREVAAAADVLLLLIPDEALPDVFTEEIAPHLSPNDAIVLASGYNLTFGGIAPPADVDVLLLAPRMIGRQLRELYQQGKGFYSYLSVERDASGRAWPTLLALAKGIGTLRLAAFELSARDETLIDLYMEQGFGAILGSLVFSTLDVATQAGLPPEALVLELYLSGEMAQTFQAMADLGFVQQSTLHSPTSQYGGMTRSIRFDREPLRRHLQQALDEIRSGAFARDWAAERKANYENFRRFQELARGANPFSAIEERIYAAIRQAQERSGQRPPP